MIRFVYFDLGNVIVYFSVPCMLQQVNEIADMKELTEKRLAELIFGSGLECRLECGEISELEFYEEFKKLLGKEIPLPSLKKAMTDIFTPNASILPVMEQLSQANIPCGILSNTSTGHWNHCKTAYPLIHQLVPTNHVLSFEVGAMKPNRAIYEAAMRQAAEAVDGIQTSEVLFIDDLETNIAAARDFGFDAILYTETPALLDELQQRGLPIH